MPELEPQGEVGDAVLDIGGDVGALVLYTDDSMLGREVEISLLGEERRTHTVIRRRTMGGRIVAAGVFPELAAGSYRVWTDEPGLPDRVTVRGGEVSELDWRREPG